MAADVVSAGLKGRAGLDACHGLEEGGDVLEGLGVIREGVQYYRPPPNSPRNAGYNARNRA